MRRGVKINFQKTPCHHVTSLIIITPITSNKPTHFKIPSTSTQHPPSISVCFQALRIRIKLPTVFKPTPTRPRRQVTGWRLDTSLLSLLFDTYHHQLHTSSSSPIKGWTTRVKLLLKGEMVVLWVCVFWVPQPSFCQKMKGCHPF